MFRFFRLLALLLPWPGATLAAPPAVLTDIAPVQSLVASVMGDLGAPALLLPGTTDPHSAQLRPSQARALSRSELVFWIGPPLTPWLANRLETLANSAQSVPLLDIPGTTLIQIGEVPDPHAWLDPENARLWLGAIAETLGAADPENADSYRANARRAAGDIAALETRLHGDLAPARARSFVTGHAAFGYFAARFELTIAASIADSDAAPPGAARLSRLRALLQRGAIACLFLEPDQNPALAENLTRGTDVKIARLDPLGRALPAGPALYGALLRQLADTIADCAAD